jgi:hypothetical protein
MPGPERMNMLKVIRLLLWKLEVAISYLITRVVQYAKLNTRLSESRRRIDQIQLKELIKPHSIWSQDIILLNNLQTVSDRI